LKDYNRNWKVDIYNGLDKPILSKRKNEELKKKLRNHYKHFSLCEFLKITGKNE